jgi:hypothetical protein
MVFFRAVQQDIAIIMGLYLAINNNLIVLPSNNKYQYIAQAIYC